jgi:membrane-associated phospholipid phosphatase
LKGMLPKGANQALERYEAHDPVALGSTTTLSVTRFMHWIFRPRPRRTEADPESDDHDLTISLQPGNATAAGSGGRKKSGFPSGHADPFMPR